MSRGFRSIVVAAGVLIPSLFLALMLLSTPRPVHVTSAPTPAPVSGSPAAAENAAQARAETEAAASERSWARSADHPSGVEATKQPQACTGCATPTASPGALNADADAKSNARDLVSQIEACWTTKHTYAACTNSSSNLPIGTGSGQVSATASNATSYTVTARSAAGHTFVITKNGSTGALSRSCTPAGRGGCQAGGRW